MDPLGLGSPFFHKHGPYRDAIHRFSAGASGRVLDIGCGSKPFREYFDVDQYVGVDVVPDAANDLRGDALHLPVQDDAFDYVLSNQVLQHLPDPFTFFREMARVLRPGGRALVTTNQAYFLNNHPDYFRFTRYGLKTLADKAGLSTEGIIEIGTTLQHLCSKIGMGIKSLLPFPLDAAGITLTNLLFWPIDDIDPWEDYSITGIVVRKPR